MLDLKRKLCRIRIKYVFVAVCILSAAFFLFDWKWLDESMKRKFSSILPVRGVHYTMASYYVPDEEHKFRCIVTREAIDFDKVNDDYCDCDDGSDEPGTAACPNGIFYCESDVYKRNAVSMPTSRVNDGICDCCDGSDEWQKINFSPAVPGHLQHVMRSNQMACPNKC